jgi:hypothetical protein
MKTKWLFALLVMGALNAVAAQPPRMPAYHDGGIVIFTVVNDNVVGVESETLEEDVAQPLYAFGPPGNQPQFDVLSIIPGEADYSPWWEVISVTVLNGRDVATDPFTSEEEILAAAEAGTVSLIETDFIFLCQVLPGVKK